MAQVKGLLFIMPAQEFPGFFYGPHERKEIQFQADVIFLYEPKFAERL